MCYTVKGAYKNGSITSLAVIFLRCYLEYLAEGKKWSLSTEAGADIGKPGGSIPLILPQPAYGESTDERGKKGLHGRGKKEGKTNQSLPDKLLSSHLPICLLQTCFPTPKVHRYGIQQQ